jgi:hypothetical protein
MRREFGRAFAVIACAGLTACITVQDRIETASANVRGKSPLLEWIEVRPEHLAEVDPARLKGEGAALLVTRAVKQSGTEFAGPSAVVMLRDISTSTIHLAHAQRTGSEDEVGWAVLLVPGGQYAINRGAVNQRMVLRHGELKATVTDVKGHPYVPLASTIRINVGDVVYVGTVVYQTPAPTPPKDPAVRDERAAAAAWMQKHLPAFAPLMQTRILPQPGKPLG